uniref:hypothetical protein n=1 Tax=Pigmentiphaga litoralis TaxID=516702 RepID=UPI003899BCD2
MDEDACGGFNDVVGGLELVDLEHSGHLGEDALEEPEVAAGDALYRGGGRIAPSHAHRPKAAI